MAKHACPSCGKRFDFEKNGWICPYCGSVVLHSAEQTVYAREQQTQRQKQQKQKRQAETLKETLRRRIPQRCRIQRIVLLFQKRFILLTEQKIPLSAVILTAFKPRFHIFKLFCPFFQQNSQ